MQRLVWYFKQLLPLTYWSIYSEYLCSCDDNCKCGNYGKTQKRITIWRMWFGRCFNIESYELS